MGKLKASNAIVDCDDGKYNSVFFNDLHKQHVLDVVFYQFQRFTSMCYVPNRINDDCILRCWLFTMLKIFDFHVM